MTRSRFAITVALLIAILLTTASPGATVQSASHREAPLIAMDAEADITDFFMFRSYESGREDNIVFIMDVIPGEEPSSGPNYYNFDPNVLYSFEIDNDRDNFADDIRIEFRFKNEFRGTNKDLGLFLSYVALPGPITALDGPGSEGLGLRQKYSVTIVKNGKRILYSDGLIAVPSNVGPRTMPDYAALAAQGVYNLNHGVRVFAGQRQDPFYIDLGAVFDTLNLRRTPLPLLTTTEDAYDTFNPFGVDMLSGFNVHSIAIEIPAAMLTADGKKPAMTATPKLGAYASTSRRQVTVLRPAYGVFNADTLAASINDAAVTDAANADADAQSEMAETAPAAANQIFVPLVTANVNGNADSSPGTSPVEQAGGNPILSLGNFIQVQRLANPLVNEAIIGTADKDLWNALDPNRESRFLDYYLNPRLALALQVVFGVPAATSNRTDLVDLLLKYSPTDTRLSELLRLDVSVAPTPFGQQKRLGPLAHDAAGVATPDAAAWPNGRRPIDDVTDIAVRVVGGSNYINAMAGDGVNVDDATLTASFPFLAPPFDGVTRVHQNP